MADKIRYEIDLTAQIATGAGPELRSIRKDDTERLAGLMLDAYIGTIDYEGEGIEEATSEVESFFNEGQPLLEHSLVVEIDGSIASAVLISEVSGSPFIGYVMTRRANKNQGLARLVTQAALSGLAAAGYEKTVLYITEGNAPSESLFRSLGARPLPAA